MTKIMSELSSPASIGLFVFLDFIAVMAGSLAVYYLLRAKEKPKILITAFSRTTENTENYRTRDVGFAVSVERKMVKDARVRFNDKNYSWVEEDGKTVERKDLHIGDAPSKFFPFESTIKYVEDITKYPSAIFHALPTMNITIESTKNGILTTLNDSITKQNILSDGIIIPKFPQKLPNGLYLSSLRIKGSANMRKFKDDVSIKLIGEGIEEKKDYVMCVWTFGSDIPIIAEKPVMNQIKVSLILKAKKRFRLRNRDFLLEF